MAPVRPRESCRMPFFSVTVTAEFTTSETCFAWILEMDAVLRVKLPLKFGLQPDGAVAEGAIPSLTACATAVAARQKVEMMMAGLIMFSG